MGDVVSLKRPAGIPAQWSDEALYAAVKAHVFGGNVQAILPMTDADVAYWTRSPQWAAMTKLILPEVKDVVIGQLSRIACKTLAALDQRITEGDPVIQIDGTPKKDDDGNQVYRPLRAKDLSDIAGKVMGEQRQLEGKSGPEQDDDIPGLSDLLDSLKRMARAKEITGTAERV